MGEGTLSDTLDFDQRIKRRGHSAAASSRRDTWQPRRDVDDVETSLAFEATITALHAGNVRLSAQVPLTFLHHLVSRVAVTLRAMAAGEPLTSATVPRRVAAAEEACLAAASQLHELVLVSQGASSAKPVPGNQSVVMRRLVKIRALWPLDYVGGDSSRQTSSHDSHHSTTRTANIGGAASTTANLLASVLVARIPPLLRLITACRYGRTRTTLPAAHCCTHASCFPLRFLYVVVSHPALFHGQSRQQFHCD